MTSEYMSRHEKASREILGKIEDILRAKGYTALRDTTNPFHRVVEVEGKKLVSIYCSGFTRLVEVQPLRINGIVDYRYKERLFSSPGGAVKWVIRHFDLERDTDSAEV